MAQHWEVRGGGDGWRDALMGRAERIARQRLIDRRNMLRTLVVENEESGAEDAAPMKQDDLEVADLREHMRVLEALKTLERHELREIDAALQRLDDGEWGSCEKCGRPIGLQRLGALPHARLCMRCGAGESRD